MSNDIVKDITIAVTSALRESTLPLWKAKELVNAAEREALTINVKMVISIVDASGNLIILHRMDGALIASIEISPCKAYTSAIFRSSTEDLSKNMLPGKPLYCLQNTHNVKCCFLGGGLPIFSFGNCIGAIGVSGGTVEEDIHVASVALNMEG